MSSEIGKILAPVLAKVEEINSQKPSARALAAVDELFREDLIYVLSLGYAKHSRVGVAKIIDRHFQS